MPAGNNKEHVEKVRLLIAEKLGVDESEVTPNASFVDDLGADSLDQVELRGLPWLDPARMHLDLVPEGLHRSLITFVMATGLPQAHKLPQALKRPMAPRAANAPHARSIVFPRSRAKARPQSAAAIR